MKIITLLGSARSKGNTATFLGWIEKELQSLGHKVESIYLNSKNINPCLGCFKCKEHTEKIGCVQNDDAIEILGKIINAELTIFASPLYFWGFSAQIKALIDRSFSFVTNYHQPNHASLIENKKQALLVTGGGSYENNAEPVFTAFDRIIKFYKGIKAGELFLDKCTTPQEMDTKIKDKAIKFAIKIAG